MKISPNRTPQTHCVPISSNLSFYGAKLWSKTASKIAVIGLTILVVAGICLKNQRKLKGFFSFFVKTSPNVSGNTSRTIVDPDSILAIPAELREERRISNESRGRMMAMEAWANSNNYDFGEANDNGDCFYDSFAQLLTKKLHRLITVKDLRQIVETKIKSLDHEKNWVMDQKNILWNDFDWTDYCMVVGFTARELREEEIFHNRPPTWGDPGVEGQILCTHYKVNLHLMGLTEDSEVREFEVIEPKNDEGGFKGEFSIHLGHLPNHFVPLFYRREDERV
jgi:hypothetical protein